MGPTGGEGEGEGEGEGAHSICQPFVERLLLTKSIANQPRR